MLIAIVTVILVILIAAAIGVYRNESNIVEFVLYTLFAILFIAVCIILVITGFVLYAKN